MSFEHKKTLETLQCVLNVLLAPGERQFTRVYLEDIIIFRKSLSEHVNHLREVLQPLSHGGVALKHKKCTLLTNISNKL